MFWFDYFFVAFWRFASNVLFNFFLFFFTIVLYLHISLSNSLFQRIISRSKNPFHTFFSSIPFFCSIPSTFFFSTSSFLGRSSLPLHIYSDFLPLVPSTSANTFHFFSSSRSSLPSSSTRLSFRQVVKSPFSPFSFYESLPTSSCVLSPPFLPSIHCLPSHLPSFTSSLSRPPLSPALPSFLPSLFFFPSNP